MTLTGKQKRFVEAFCGPALLNASKAARDAGYSERSAAIIGFENLRKPAIAEAIKEQLEKFSMSAAEATERMAAMSRGELPTKTVEKSGVNAHTTEEYDTKDATKDILRLHGSYEQPESGPQFLIVRDLKDVIPKEDK